MIRFIAALIHLSLLAGVVAVNAYADHPETLYGPCIHQSVYELGGELSMAVFGTSRTGRGIDPAVIEQRMSDDPNPIAVLPRGQRGFGDQFARVRSALEVQGVRDAVLVEFSKPSITQAGDRAQDYQGYGPNFAVRVSSADLVRDMGTNTERVDAKLHVLLDSFAKRIDYHLGEFAENGIDLPETQMRQREVETIRCGGRNGESPRKQRQLDNLKRAMERDFGSWTAQPDTVYDFDLSDHERYRSYLHRIVDLGAEHDVAVLFFHMPEYLEAPLADSFVETFETDFGAPLLAAPPDVLAAIYEGDGYNNRSHVNEIGRALYTDWLADEVIERLATS